MEELCPQSLTLEHPRFAASEILQDRLHAGGGAEFQQLLWQSRACYRAWFCLCAGGCCLLTRCPIASKVHLMLPSPCEPGSPAAHAAQELGKADPGELLLPLCTGRLQWCCSWCLTPFPPGPSGSSWFTSGQMLSSALVVLAGGFPAFLPAPLSSGQACHAQACCRLTL